MGRLLLSIDTRINRRSSSKYNELSPPRRATRHVLLVPRQTAHVLQQQLSHVRLETPILYEFEQHVWFVVAHELSRVQPGLSARRDTILALLILSPGLEFWCLQQYVQQSVRLVARGRRTAVPQVYTTRVTYDKAALLDHIIS